MAACRVTRKSSASGGSSTPSSRRGTARPSTGWPAICAQLLLLSAEDPDVLDPTLGRTYVGRIVFSSICDKLFDIDEKLNVVPQLATSHETSADGLAVTIKLRSGVKFHDGEPFDEKMKRLVAELQEQQVEAKRLDEAIEENLKGLGFGKGFR